jgi:hypothetical protein
MTTLLGKSLGIFIGALARGFDSSIQKQRYDVARLELGGELLWLLLPKFACLTLRIEEA